MAIKFFWMYIGAFLACSIVLVTFVKQFSDGFAGSGKKPLVYGGISSVIASGAAFISGYFIDHLFTLYWVFSGIFLLFGIIHMALVHNRYFYAREEDKSKVIIGEIIFGFSIIFFMVVIFSSLQYFLHDKVYLFYPMLMSGIAFFVPMLVHHTFEAAYSIPAPVYSYWSYPINQTIEPPPPNPKEKLIVIGFELKKNIADKKRTYFRAKAPEHFELGELFYHFINDYNELHGENLIEYVSTDNEAYEWWFRVKHKWYRGKEILDPSLSFKDNGIMENTVIICERI